MSNSVQLDETNHGFPQNKYNPHAWVRGEPEIGEGTWIGPFTIVDAHYAKLQIGKGCNIASGAKIMSHSTVRRCISEGEINVVDKADTFIGDYCFIGTNAVVLMGAEIGDHSVVGAGCVVPEFMKIPPYSLVVGVPAKIVGSSKKLLKEKAK
jgi:carbonic anhydrase/acetyltransferase-like protein (isoleucine patch superfamily)